jgi:hypothetical protein
MSDFEVCGWPGEYWVERRPYPYLAGRYTFEKYWAAVDFVRRLRLAHEYREGGAARE